jgi:hypothetical protein
VQFSFVAERASGVRGDLKGKGTQMNSFSTPLSSTAPVRS